MAATSNPPRPNERDVVRVLVDLVQADGAVPVAELIERTHERLQLNPTDRVSDVLVESALEEAILGPLHLFADDMVGDVRDVVRDRVFSHRINDAELELGILVVSVDLPTFGRLDRVRRPDGTELTPFSVEEGHVAWGGPDGWLAEFPADTVIVVAASDLTTHDDGSMDATVHIEAVADVPPPTADLVHLLVGAYRDEQTAGLAVSCEEIVLRLCRDHPDLFTTPLAPVSEWIDAAGLQLSGNRVAHDAGVWRLERLARRQFAVIDMVPEPQRRQIIARALEVLDDPDAAPAAVRKSLAACCEPEALDVLADALVPELLPPEAEFDVDGIDSPKAVFELVARATSLASRPREVAVAEYLACVLRERCGQPHLAEEALRRAATARPELDPIAERMGWYCFDRGDAKGAAQWWQRLDDLPLAANVLSPFLRSAGGAEVGRNAPCWCGSGRKYKQCHLGVVPPPTLPDRVAWLVQKAVSWLDHTAGEHRRLAADLVLAYVAGDPDADMDDAIFRHGDAVVGLVEDAFEEPLVYDLVMHEGGGFARFLHERGPLLPDDERLLAEEWLVAARSVHEVTSVDPGVGLTLRDLASGEVVPVRERTMSRWATPGECFCLRIVPDGATHQIIGGPFPVRVGRELQVLDLCEDGDPLEIAAWAGAMRNGPRIEHRPGLLDAMIDRDAIDQGLADLGDVDQQVALAYLQSEISRQAQAAWLDVEVPALGGLTPRQAAADPTRVEQLERLLAAFDRRNAGLDELRRHIGPTATGGPIEFDTDAVRGELGLA